jgi:hypothetical protein
MYIQRNLIHLLNSHNLLDTPLYFLGFFTIHGLLFLGGGYAISYSDPGFALMHSGIGVFVYLIFFFALFPTHARSALIGAILTLAAGYYWGDFLLDSFYPASLERTTLHKMYATMLVLYFYVYTDIAVVILKSWWLKRKSN